MGFLDIRNVTKSYGNVEVLHRVDIAVEEGEFLVLVGPSGCGKSTTLRMVAGLEEISEGELYIDGKLMNDVAPKDRDIACALSGAYVAVDDWAKARKILDKVLRGQGVLAGAAWAGGG